MHSPENVTSTCILLIDTAKLLAQRIIPYTVHDMENLTFSTDDKDYPKWKHIACIASVEVVNYIPSLLLSSFCIDLFIFHVHIYSYNDNSYDPCIVIFDPSTGCCAQSLPSGFRHFQPESAQKIRSHPHGKSASACVESASTRAEVLRHPCGKSASFHTTIRGCPRGTNTEFLRKS